MSTVFAALLPVFLLIVLGFVLRRLLLTEEAHWVGCEQLVYYVLFPALLIETLARADLAHVPVVGVGGALLLAVAAVSILCLSLQPLLATRLGIGGAAFTSIFQGATRWQTYVALAVAGNLFGDAGLALASVAIIAMIPPLNVINVWVLAHYAAPQRPPWHRTLLTIARNPLIWACLIGLAINVTGIPVPHALLDFASVLGRSALAIGLLTVGAGLQLKGMSTSRMPVVLTIGLKLVAMPAIAIALGLAFNLSGQNLAVVACCASVPSTSNAYVLARQMGGDAALLAQILTLQTALAVFTMPVAIMLAT